MKTFKSSIDQARTTAEVDAVTLSAIENDIEALPRSAKGVDPKSAFERIRDIAQRLRSL